MSDDYLHVLAVDSHERIAMLTVEKPRTKWLALAASDIGAMSDFTPVKVIEVQMNVNDYMLRSRLEQTHAQICNWRTYRDISSAEADALMAG